MIKSGSESVPVTIELISKRGSGYIQRGRNNSLEGFASAAGLTGKSFGPSDAIVILAAMTNYLAKMIRGKRESPQRRYLVNNMGPDSICESYGRR